MQTDHDVVVIGAGFAGIYSVHKLRDGLGLRVQAFDAGEGPGGTWHWNRYPGARCDFDSVFYSYSFSDELQREWRWSERFAAQPEILAYLEWCADKLDVRKEFRFRTRVTSIVWDDANELWTVGTDDGRTCTTRFVVAGGGNVTVPKKNEFPGEETFRGEIHRTSSWPHEPVDLTGKRVGVIGTGSTGLQVIPEVARACAHLTVFQRTANFAAPLGNRPLTEEESRHQAENHAEVRAGSRDNFLGAPYGIGRPSALLDSPEERKKLYDEFYYPGGGFRLVVGTYQDLLVNKEANDTIADYLRDRIRERVNDPATAELLCPTDHPYGTKRAPFETDYYETFNLDHVDLVDVRTAPIEAITETGLRTAAAEYDLDVIILATGFDALTGTLLRMGIVGRDGLTLEQAWEDGPKTYLGLQLDGFPNLFTITGPQSAVALYNNAMAIEDHVELAHDAIKHVLDHDARVIEPTADAVQAWGRLAEGILNMTLIPQSPNSWYMGRNIPGKPRGTYIFAGGAPLYRAICQEMIDKGFAGFALDGSAPPVPPMVRLDPPVAVVIGALAMQGVKPLEQCTVEETRELLETMTLLQAPPRDTHVQEVTYPSPSGQRLSARIYRPDVDGTLPVVTFFHPGGWIAGSLDVVDERCRALAHELQAVVVSASYRLAPEHPFPAATDDNLAALRWVAETIGEHGGDPDRIVVMGESAGAHLAAVAAQRARDEDGPQLAAQVLIYPPIDPDTDTPSRAEFAAGPFLSVAAADAMWGAYLGDPANRTAPHANPGKADLAGLAPALVLTAELDPTRDEAEAYGAALQAAGVDAEVRRIDGMIHGTFLMSGLVPRSLEFTAAITDFLEARLATPAEV
ncbi:alpha/beta hydrolase fold domain-containing protein [Paraconexibacter antarcticus]|uniref:Alpha/beta hydrolase fold domain-containing protein n=1 Tax=Paraconexibacter antarcticus TaxID=2949664 RepID=A0ABY5DLF6_9ACTN|nr:alpha/beta hydrolase fold domain-containing protein [Paraconexibacter antarcticus]UTI62646.1 alpha/beta hydrolase fold domain-containing protein [Paraconexibacter antarcticus]